MASTQPYVIIITGPTGVGKTELALSLAQHIPSEIINGDVGQFYTPLTIGTAKPDWQNEPVPHHLFDIINEPQDCTVVEYRERVSAMVDDIWQRGRVPIIVGGSLFYIKSLFYPPQTLPISTVKKDESCEYSWEYLQKIDPLRAVSIDKNDTYRIARAIDIWRTSGIKPSAYKVPFDPFARGMLIYITRDRQELYDRINMRVKQMMDEGWLEEVEPLLNSEWEPFLYRKKLIGYPDILTYLKGDRTPQEKQFLIDSIAKKTRNYAKRQATFWRMLKGLFDKEKDGSIETPELHELNLTSTDLRLYIKQLLMQLSSVIKK